MENPKRTKLGLLLIGLCSFAHSYEYSGPIINSQRIVYPTSYQNYYNYDNIVSRQDYQNRLVTGPNLYTPIDNDQRYIYENYKRIDPRRIIPFEQLRTYDDDAYKYFSEYSQYDFFAPQYVLDDLFRYERPQERLRYFCKYRNKIERRPHRNWKKWHQKKQKLIEVTPGQKIFPKIDNRYKDIDDEYYYRYGIYNDYDYGHDHDQKYIRNDFKYDNKDYYKRYVELTNRIVISPGLTREYSFGSTRNN